MIIAGITIGVARFTEMIRGWLPEQIVPEKAMAIGPISLLKILHRLLKEEPGLVQKEL